MMVSNMQRLTLTLPWFATAWVKYYCFQFIFLSESFSPFFYANTCTGLSYSAFCLPSVIVYFISSVNFSSGTQDLRVCSNRRSLSHQAVQFLFPHLVSVMLQPTNLSDVMERTFHDLPYCAWIHRPFKPVH